MDLPLELVPHWSQYNLELFTRFDLSIAGFVILGFTPRIPLYIQKEYARFSPHGVGSNIASYDQEFVSETPFHYVKDMTNGHLPPSADAVEQGLYADITADPGNTFWFFRTILAAPDRIADGFTQLQTNHPELNVEVVDPYTWYRFYRDSRLGHLADDIISAEFDADGGAGERPFLYSDNYSDLVDGHRYADLNASWTYRFDLVDSASKVTVELELSNNYVIQVSNDDLEWEQVAAANGLPAPGTITLDLSSYLQGNGPKRIYLKFSDGSVNDGYGPSLWRVNLEVTETAASLSGPHRTSTAGEKQQVSSGPFPFRYWRFNARDYDTRGRRLPEYPTD
jgi:hypothetical protein